MSHNHNNVDHDEIVANRIRHYLRNYFGFYPTNNTDSRYYYDENKSFKRLVRNIVYEVTNRNIIGKNIRHKLQSFNYMVREQARFLWDFASQPHSNLRELFDTYDTVESYVHAVAFAVIGSYDNYLTNKEKQHQHNEIEKPLNGTCN